VSLEVTVGAEVPGFTRHLDIVDLVAYAGATWDWHRLHYDQAYLDAVGVPAPVVDGQVFGAYLVEQVQDWAGPSARVVAAELRYRTMVYAGQSVTVTGRIVAVDGAGEGRRVTVEQTVTTDAGDVAATGSTVAEVPA
jgi:acyl dehydratase